MNSHRIAAVTVSLAAAVFLAGCASGSGPKEYTSTSSLREAYVNAGQPCDNPMDVPESMVGTGAHAILCGPGVNMLIVFDSDASRDLYLSKALGQADMEAVVGPGWAVMTTDAAGIAGQLGGKVEK